MKTHSLPVIAFLAALVAAAVLPFSGSTICFVLTFAGVVAMLAADYGREIRPVSLNADVVPFEAHGGRTELGKAA
ncbi:MAG TPA: hypothetical protein VGG37_01515 [Opitutaceae bacterium]|jgi:uncharacterized oligopeptide transporter (OPT) family protein